MRVGASGCSFFVSDDWMWAVVDVVIVAGALFDVALDIVEVLSASDAGLSGIDGVSSLKVPGQTR